MKLRKSISFVLCLFGAGVIIVLLSSGPSEDAARGITDRIIKDTETSAPTPLSLVQDEWTPYEGALTTRPESPQEIVPPPELPVGSPVPPINSELLHMEFPSWIHELAAGLSEEDFARAREATPPELREKIENLPSHMQTVVYATIVAALMMEEP